MSLTPISQPLVIDGQLIRHAVEIGAGDSFSSQVLPLASHVERIQLVEPNMILAEKLSAAANTWKGRVTVHGCAVGATAGRVPLVHMGYASYLLGAPSFLATSIEPDGESYWSPLTAPVTVTTMDQIDDGTIDYLVLTSNGSELDCLAAMRSRPYIIRTKFYLHNAKQGVVAQQVVTWLREHGYWDGRVVESNQHGTYQHAEWRLSQ